MYILTHKLGFYHKGHHVKEHGLSMSMFDSNKPSGMISDNVDTINNIINLNKLPIKLQYISKENRIPKVYKYNEEVMKDVEGVDVTSVVKEDTITKAITEETLTKINEKYSDSLTMEEFNQLTKEEQDNLLNCL
jgi:protoheme ferro-lyase